MKLTIAVFVRRHILGIAVLLLPAAPVIAGLATFDIAGQTRAAPRATMGAFEVGTVSATPAAPLGLSIAVQLVTP